MRIRLSAVLAATLWILSAAAARADIYQTTADDGALTLSNLPGARRDVLISEVAGPGASAAPTAVDPGPAAHGGTTGAASSGSRSAVAVRPDGMPAEPAVPPRGAPAGAAHREADAVVHFAPGAPGAPAASDSQSASHPSEPTDRKVSESGWPRLAREATPGRPMPVAPSLLPSWALLAPPGSGGDPSDSAPVAEGARTAADTPAPSAVPDTAAGLATDDIVAAVAMRHALDPALLHAIVTVESAYNVRALSPRGAAGLMQLLPETARRYGISDLFDPVQNLTAGARYLRDLLALFKQDLALALAAYNAGENAVIRHGNVIPPYPETQSYVPRVLATYRAYSRFFAHRRQPG